MSRAAIYGAGSLGTILGAFITKNGGQIDLINHNQAHVKALNENGAKIVGTMEFTQKVTAITDSQMSGHHFPDDKAAAQQGSGDFPERLSCL